MMSISSIKSGSAQSAAQYYSEESYYEKDSQPEFTRWWGNGAERLGLDGKVDSKSFAQLLAGDLPNGDSVPKPIDPKLSHRMGYDFTFSAPKSVSQAVLVGGDWRLYDAHKKAVGATLAEIEADCATARHTVDGSMEYEKTSNLTVACFTHMTSRALDPQLHDHAAILNITQRSDGKWMSLASTSPKLGAAGEGFAEQVYRDQLYYGAIYHADLAKRAKELGYDIEVVGANGMWELTNIPPEVRELQSKRRGQIEKALEKYQNPNAKVADIETVATRDDKRIINPKNLEQHWVQEIKEGTGFDIKEAVNKVVDRQTATPNFTPTADEPVSPHHFTDKEQSFSRPTLEAVDRGLDYLSQFKLSFDFHELIKVALNLSNGDASVGDIKACLEFKIKTGEVLAHDKQAAKLTTAALIEKEQQLLSLANRLSSETNTTDTSKLSSMNNKLKTLVGDHHKVAIINTTSARQQDTIKSLLDEFEKTNKTVKVLFPNQVEHREIEGNYARQSTGLLSHLINHFKADRTDTVGGYTYKEGQITDSPLSFLRNKNHVLLVDSANKLSTSQLSSILQTAEDNGARVLFLNHTAGQKSMFASDGMALLKRSGIKEHYLKNLTKEAGNLKVQILDKDTNALAENYRRGTKVITDTKTRQAELTDAIRDSLKARGELAKEGVNVTAIAPVFQAEDKRYLTDYKRGDHLMIYGQKNKGYRVRNLDHAAQTLSLYSISTGRTKTLSFEALQEKQSTLFRKQKLPVAAGERLLATHNQKQLGLLKGQSYQVTHIDNAELRLKAAGSEEVSVPKSEWQSLPLAYDYVRTISQAGKKSGDHVFLDVKHRNLSANLIETLSGITNKELTVLTDSVEKAQTSIELCQEKGLALDLVVQSADQLMPERKILTQHDKVAMAKDILLALQNRGVTEKAIDFAITKLSERQAGFTYKDVLKEALAEATGVAKKDTINVKLEKMIGEGELVTGELDNKDDVYLTTPHAIKQEAAIVRLINRNVEAMPKLNDDPNLKAPEFFTQGQASSFEMILNTSSRFVTVQGLAGTGKSTLWTSIKQTLEDKQSKTTILGLAPTHDAVKQLRSKGIESQTLQSFLVEQKKEATDLSNTLIVLDESSMASTHDFLNFLTIVEKQNGRAAIQGDAIQNQAIEEGRPHDLALERSKIPRSYNNEIKRQQNATMLNLVKHAVKNEHKAALNVLDNMAPIHIERDKPHLTDELKTSLIDADKLETHPDYKGMFTYDKKDRREYDSENKAVLRCAVDDFLSRKPQVRDKTFFIVATRDDMDAANLLLRDAFRKEGMLSKQGSAFKRLENIDKEKIELTKLHHYIKGRTVILGGNYYTVKEANTKTGFVTLEDREGNARQFSPAHNKQSVELYSTKNPEHSKLNKGDLIRMTKTFKDKDIYAKQRWQVLQARNGKATLKAIDSERTIELDSSKIEDSHWAYDYTITSYSAQGRDDAYAIGLQLAWHKNTVSARGFYVLASRAQHHTVVYTTDKNALAEQLREDKDKVSAVEVLQSKKMRVDIGKLPKTEKLPNPSKKGSEAEKRATNPSPSVGKPEPKLLDGRAISEGLSLQAEDVAQRLLGAPKHRTNKELRFGRDKGSLVVTTSGKYAGKWRDWSTEEKGDMVGLIMNTLSLNYYEALQFGEKLLGGSFSVSALEHRMPVKEKPLKSINDKPSKTQLYALKLIEQSKHIKGTLAEKYLRQCRKILADPGKEIRFHPRVGMHKDENGKWVNAPALLAIARSKDGKFQSVQATYLDPKTGNKAKTDVAKRTYGSLSDESGQRFVEIGKKGKLPISIVAEGNETALSAKQALKDAQVISTLGKENYAKVEPERLEKTVIFVLDNDGKSVKTDPVLNKAFAKQINAGKDVYAILPEQLDGRNKTDLNDVLQKGGEAAVAKAFENIRKVTIEPASNPLQPEQYQQFKQQQSRAVERDKQLSMQELNRYDRQRLEQLRSQQDIQRQQSVQRENQKELEI